MYDETPIYSHDGIIVHRKIFEYWLDNPGCKIEYTPDDLNWYETSTPQFNPNFKYRIKPKEVEVEYVVYELKYKNGFQMHSVLPKGEVSKINAWKLESFEVKQVATFTKTETKEINL